MSLDITEENTEEDVTSQTCASLLLPLTFAAVAATAVVLVLDGGFGLEGGGGAEFDTAHVHSAALAVGAVRLALVALLEVLHTLDVVQVGKVLIAHLQALLISKVISQDLA